MTREGEGTDGGVVIAAQSAATVVSADGAASPGAVPPASLDASGALVGTRLLHFRVVEPLGKGGMGVVYKAIDEKLRRPVALKLLSGGFADDTRRAMLLREARSAAGLSHPSVAAIYDIHETRGITFIAMELVEGETLRARVRKGAMPMPELARLAVEIARGLGSAHKRRIIHRDLKPDNVMVTAEGHAKILDFGLAKPIAALADLRPDDDAAPASGTETRAGSVMGTPRYMSPEQARGETLDERSDVFSLGATLYELASGTAPFDAREREREPGAWGGEGSRDWARRDLAKASPRTPPALASVIERCLSFAPERRFANGDEAARALEAVGSELGLLPRSVGRRRLWPAIAVVAVAACTGAVVLLRSRPKPGAECAAPEAKLVGIWDAARRDAVGASFGATGLPYATDAVRSVNAALDAYARDWSAMRTDACLATRVRGEQSDEMLDLRMTCLDQRRSEMRALTDLFARADVGIVERAVSAAGSLPEIATCANAALLRTPVPPPREAASVAAVGEVKERLTRASADLAAGRFPEALELAKGAHDRAKAIAYAPLLAEAALALAIARGKMGDHAEEEAAANDAIVAAQVAHDDGVAAAAWEELTEANAWRREFAAGRQSARVAEATIERNGGDARLTMQLEFDLGMIDRKDAHYDDARAHYERALSVGRRAYSEDDVHLARVYSGLATLAANEGHYEDGLLAFRRALSIEERALGSEHPSVADTLANIAYPLEHLGRNEEALGVAERSLAIREKVLGADSRDVATSLHILGNIEDDLGHHGRAVSYLRKALAADEKALGPDAAEVATALGDLGSALEAAGGHDEARALLDRALAVYRSVEGPEHPDVCMTLINLGNVGRGTGDASRARDDDGQAVAVCLKAFKGADHPYVAAALCNLGRDQVALHAAALGRDSLERGVAMWDRLHDRTAGGAEGRFALAGALWDSGGDRARAVALAEDARSLFAADGGRSAEALASVEAWLAKRPSAAGQK